jgi:hypothetical protein
MDGDRGGRAYELTIVGARVREVACRIGEWRVRITHTFRDGCAGRTLVQLGETCRLRA